MRGIWGRLLLPLIISLVGFTLTLYWYFYTGQTSLNDYEGQQPIAFLKSGVNDIDKRPAKRLIWQSVRVGDQMYSGERLRTSSKAEGVVHLVESGTLIGLEPDSLIVLEKTRGEISLDLLDGALFVKKQEEPEKGGKKDGKTVAASAVKAPIIKAGKTKIELGGKDAEMSLSIDKKGQANLAVTKGTIEVKGADNKNVVMKEGAAGAITKTGVTQETVIQVIAPSPNAILDVGSGGTAPVTFRWKPIDKQYKVFLEKGETREAITRFTTVPVMGDAGGMKMSVSIGVFFWRLVALKDGQEDAAMKSIVYKAEAASFSPPEVLSPTNEEKIFLTEESVTIELNWTAPKGLESFLVEVSSNRDFSSSLLSKKIESKTDLAIKIPKEGKYFWRVSGQWTGKAELTRSQTSSFLVEKVKNLEPPVLKYPPNGEKIFASKMQNDGLFLEWEATAMADRYRISIEPKSGGNAESAGKVKQDVLDTQFRITKLPPGEYRWVVQAVSEKKNSEWSSARTFSVIKLVSLAWEAPQEKSIVFDTEKPSVTLKWQRGPKEATVWRLRYSDENRAITEATWKTVKTPQVLLNLEKEGSYSFQAQAIDVSKAAKDGAETAANVNIVGETPVLKLEFKPNPKLPPPAFAANLGAKVKANADGSAVLTWTAVQGAARYLVRLEDLKTKAFSKLEVKETKIRLKDLLPGGYRVSLGSINKNGDVGEMGPSKTVEVPKQSNIAAPVVKKIEVK